MVKGAYWYRLDFFDDPKGVIFTEYNNGEPVTELKYVSFDTFETRKLCDAPQGILHISNGVCFVGASLRGRLRGHIRQAHRLDLGARRGNDDGERYDGRKFYYFSVIKL